VATAALDNAINNAPFHLDTNGPTAPPPPKMVRVKLLRNYRPMERPNPAYVPNPKQEGRYLPPVFEIVGHWKPAVIVRNKLGKDETLAPETFVEGEPAPSSKSGVGYADKLWAGTIVRVTSEEGKYLRANNIGEIEIDD
jgi:hypothetical protein